MYIDEHGDKWASYNDYVSYCKQAKNDETILDYNEIVENIIDNAKLSNIYIDSSNHCGNNDEEHKKSLERGN